MKLNRQKYELGLEILLNTFSTLGTRILALVEIDTLFVCLDPDYEPRNSPFRPKTHPMESIGGLLELTFDWMGGNVRNSYISKKVQIVQDQIDHLYKMVKQQKPDVLSLVDTLHAIRYLLPFSMDKTQRNQLLGFCDKTLARLNGKMKKRMSLSLAQTLALTAQLHQETDVSFLERIKLLLKQASSLKEYEVHLVDICQTLTIGNLFCSKVPNPSFVAFAEDYIATIQEPLHQQQLTYILARAQQRLQPSFVPTLPPQLVEDIKPTPPLCNLLFEKMIYLWETNQEELVEEHIKKLQEWFLTNLSVAENLRQEAQQRVVRKAEQGQIPKLDYKGEYKVFHDHLVLSFHIAVKLAQISSFSKQTDSLLLITSALESKLVTKYSPQVLSEICKAWAHLNQPKPIIAILQQMFTIMENEATEIGVQILAGLSEKRLEVSFNRLFDGMLFFMETAAIAYYHSADTKIIKLLRKIQKSELLTLVFSSQIPVTFIESLTLLFLHMLARTAFEELTQLSWKGAYGYWEIDPLMDLSEIQGGLVSTENINTVLQGVRGTKGLKNLTTMTLPPEKHRKRTAGARKRSQSSSKPSPKTWTKKLPAPSKVSPTTPKSSKQKRPSSKNGKQTSAKKTRRR